MVGPWADVDVILMAAGFSRRFGEENKLLAPFLGKPLLLHTLDLFHHFAGLGQVFVSFASPEVEKLAKNYPFSLLQNSCPQRGSCESVRLGVQASSAAYYLFVTCDQPFLDADTLRRLLCLRAEGKMVQPAYKGRPGSPVLFSAKFRGELLALQDGEAARSILQRHKEAVLQAELPDILPLLDVDRPEDLQHLQMQAAQF